MTCYSVYTFFWKDTLYILFCFLSSENREAKTYLLLAHPKWCKELTIFFVGEVWSGGAIRSGTWLSDFRGGFCFSLHNFPFYYQRLPGGFSFSSCLFNWFSPPSPFCPFPSLTQGSQFFPVNYYPILNIIRNAILNY